MAGFHVVVTDLETGEVLEHDVAEDDYCLLTTGSCQLESVRVSGKPYGSTHQLKVTGRTVRERSSAEAIARNTLGPQRGITLLRGRNKGGA